MIFAERVTIYLLLFISLFISAFFIDLFPFSLNPLFTKRTHKYTYIQLRDQDGKSINNSSFGVYLDYASQFEKSSLNKETTINKMGNHLEQAPLKIHLLRKLQKYPFIENLQAKVINVSGTQKGPQYNSYHFVIQNPYFKRQSPVNAKVYEQDKYRRRIKNGVLLAP